MNSRGTASGFTIIELLIVIAIIATIAAIIFPVFAAAKERGQMMRCLTHLTQLSRAFALYASDHGGKPPRLGGSDPIQSWYGGTWGGYIYFEKGDLWPYTKNRDLYMCRRDWRVPAEDVMALAKERGQPEVYEWAKTNYPLSYSMNSSLENKVLDCVRLTKHVMLLIHEGRKTINDGSFKVVDPKKGNWFDVPSMVHYDGTTIAYVDMHAAWRSYKELIAERPLWYVEN